MNNTTELDKVKEVAKMLLHLEIRETELSPMIVSHPIFQSVFFPNKEKQIVNILENKEGYDYVINQYERMIDKRVDYTQLITLITKPYRLVFYKMSHMFVSKGDAGKGLKTAWQNSEGTNVTINMTLAEMKKWFKEIPREYLMTEEELKILDDFPDVVTVYRGLQDQNAKIKALSWTWSKDTAKWFADRLCKSEGVYQAEIEKKYILACFKSEEEVICDYTKLKNIQRIIY